VEVLTMAGGGPLDSSATASTTAPTRRPNGRSPLVQIVLTDEETMMEEVDSRYADQEKMGESPGEPLVLHGSAAHPFTQACFILKLMLGMYAVLQALTPVLIMFATDPLQTEMILDSIALLVAILLSVLFHHTLQEELLVYTRAYGTREAQGQIGGRIKGAAAAFATSFLIGMVVERAEAYSGEISAPVIWLTSFFIVTFVLLAIVLVVRQQVLFRADYLNPV
jgi:hypothetical protein